MNPLVAMKEMSDFSQIQAVFFQNPRRFHQIGLAASQGVFSSSTSSSASAASNNTNNFLTPPLLTGDFHDASVSPNTADSSLSSISTGSAGSGTGSSVCSAAKLVQFRGHNVAAFDIDGREMICLPQIYEIFLKNMVGGLHTVYTKLKRLDINPTVCNVEQVRALRSLGAIQPGVNRCKLLETSDFEKLYEDCTSTCTRPGRPSKRAGAGYDEWSGSAIGGSAGAVTKKDKTTSDDIATSSGAVFQPQLMPQLTPQQILMQHFVALTQKTQNTFEGGEDDEQNQRSCDDEGTPLNLSKSGSGGDSSASASENNDADSLENMRKEDCSPNNSVSDRGGSNSNSGSMSMEAGSSSSSGKNDDGSMLNKVMSLIEIASQQFKHEREELWRERNEIQVLRESFHKIVQEERDLRKKLESQNRRCAAFEKRYKFVNRQLLLVNAELRRYKEAEQQQQQSEHQEQARGASEHIVI